MCVLPVCALGDQLSEHQGRLQSHRAASPTSAVGNDPPSGMDRDVLPAASPSLPADDTPHPATHTTATIHTPNEQGNSYNCYWPWEDSGTKQRCRGKDFSGGILAICRTTDSFLWASPCWIILSRLNMLIGAGAQPALYPLPGPHHIPAKDWKSKATKPKQKRNCVLRRKKPFSLQAI